MLVALTEPQLNQLVELLSEPRARVRALGASLTLELPPQRVADLMQIQILARSTRAPRNPTRAKNERTMELRCAMMMHEKQMTVRRCYPVVVS